ncbi:MAG TPA: 3-hydroxyacyl-CoA dehydrogenase [Firmicutes bacterium]|nr:3-hydroxyacyl-CoA dehydrogenase [Bacillota bacterium]
MDDIIIVGPGRMCVGIAVALVQYDYSVTIVDTKHRNPGEEGISLKKAERDIRFNLELLNKLGRIKKPLDSMMSKIRTRSGLGDGPLPARFIFETLPEDPEIKKMFYAGLGNFLDDNTNTVVASATSTISLDLFQEQFAKPENLIIAHWLNPAFIIPLVEVAINDKTSQSAINITMELLRKAGKTPVLCKNSPGFIVPRIQTAAMNEAVRIYEENVASVEDIDIAIKKGFGFRLSVLGLIEFIDLGGVDILYFAGMYLSKTLGQPQFIPPLSTKEKMDKNEIGPKTGKGYYNYEGVDMDVLLEEKYRAFFKMLDLVNKEKE